jgi:hypothetical protein
MRGKQLLLVAAYEERWVRTVQRRDTDVNRNIGHSAPPKLSKLWNEIM